MATPDRYPFIDFTFDTATLSAGTWLMLGEAMSKCQHLAGVPLKPEAAAELSAISLARGVHATTAIEGNTLSEDEVRAIVDQGTADVSESREYLQREAQNVLGEIRAIDEALKAGVRLPISVERLCHLNAQVLAGVPDKPEVVPGEIRQHNVTAGPYLAPAWSEVGPLLEQFVTWLQKMRSEVGPESSREDRFVTAVLSAMLAHLYIAWIHPFGNGNGRLARLVEVQILSESGVVPVVATNLLSDHYNKTRNAYYLALDGARRDIRTFINYALRGYLDELREQIDVVRRENLKIHWESYVYERFRSMPNTDARDRQRDVALGVPAGKTVSPEGITELTPHLARLYAVAGERLPARDLNDLVKMGLFIRVGRRAYQAQREVIQAFIPPTAH